MSPPYDDPLWSEFAPLWEAMRAAHPPVILAGGYGLFLKQLSVLERKDERIVVPLSRWRSFAPRATKDLDILIGIDVIADEEQLEIIGRALRHCGFQEIRAKWQFRKVLAGDRQVHVDLHAPEPPEDHPDVRADRMRVKNLRARGEDRVHGRLNEEAVGAHHATCDITWNGLVVSVPNPLTWSIMKVTAAGERWAQSQDQERTPEKRTEQRYQALKHAADAGRVVALMGQQERDHLAAITARVRATPAYATACAMRREHFAPAGFASAALGDIWTPEDAALIAGLLSEWMP